MTIADISKDWRFARNPAREQHPYKVCPQHLPDFVPDSFNSFTHRLRCRTPDVMSQWRLARCVSMIPNREILLPRGITVFC